jgi:hypothetical protein
MSVFMHFSFSFAFKSPFPKIGAINELLSLTLRYLGLVVNNNPSPLHRKVIS